MASPWALFTYIDGEPYDFGERGQVEEAARRLAHFHALAETFAEDSVVVEYDPPIRNWWMYAEENVQASAALYAARAVDAELAYVRDWWRWVLAEWPLARVDALPVGWVHGDYHGRNMVFVGNTMRGLFDFDDLNRGPLVYDIARAVHMFGRESRASLHLRPDVARYVVDESERERKLTSEERAALPMMVAMYYPPNARYHRYCEQRGEDIVARLRREVGIMRVLQTEMLRIGPWLTAHLVPETGLTESIEGTTRPRIIVPQPT